MKTVGADALLTLAALLGSFGMAAMLQPRPSLETWDQLNGTLGVTAFLSAMGFMIERHGAIAASVLLLAVGLFDLAIQRWKLPTRTLTGLGWPGLIVLFLFIGLLR